MLSTHLGHMSDFVAFPALINFSISVSHIKRFEVHPRKHETVCIYCRTMPQETVLGRETDRGRKIWDRRRSRRSEERSKPGLLILTPMGMHLKSFWWHQPLTISHNRNTPRCVCEDTFLRQSVVFPQWLLCEYSFLRFEERGFQ